MSCIAKNPTLWSTLFNCTATLAVTDTTGIAKAALLDGFLEDEDADNREFDSTYSKLAFAQVCVCVCVLRVCVCVCCVCACVS